MNTTTATAQHIEAPITLTPSALKALKNILATENPNGDLGLRVGVKGGGCSGMTYVLELDQTTEHDQHFELDGLPMFMDKRHALYLMGMEVDYQDGLNARGFAFRNPNATETCGCGTSFAV